MVNSNSPLTSEALADHIHMMGILSDRKPHTLDLSDDRQYRFILQQHTAAGRSPQSHPQVFADIQQARSNHTTQGLPQEKTLLQLDNPPLNMWVSICQITKLGIQSDNVTVQSSALTSTTAPVTMNDQILQIYDIENPSSPVLINTASQSIPGGGTYDEIDVTGVLPVGHDDCEIVFFNNITPASDEAATAFKAGQPVFIAQSSGPTQIIRSSAEDPIQPIVFTNPVSHFSRNYVKVALNRNQQQQPDCDYWYQTGTSGPQPVVGIGGQGNAVWSSNIQALAVPDTFYASLSLVNHAGGGTSVFANASQLLPYFNIDQNNPGQLDWNFAPYNFAQAMPWQSGDSIDYYLSVSIKLTNSPLWATITLGPNPSGANDNAYAQVLPIIFVWGCLASGTRITLPDGTHKPIEQMVVGDHVLADTTGRVLKVRDTIIGQEVKPMIHIICDNGQSILTTETHPFVTCNGIALARNLKVGTQVQMAQVIAKVANIEHMQHDGFVYNLVLSELDGTQPNPEDSTTHYANGFMVGDDQMQSVWSHRDRPGQALLKRHQSIWNLHHAAMQGNAA